MTPFAPTPSLRALIHRFAGPLAAALSTFTAVLVALLMHWRTLLSHPSPSEPTWQVEVQTVALGAVHTETVSSADVPPDHRVMAAPNGEDRRVTRIVSTFRRGGLPAARDDAEEITMAFYDTHGVPLRTFTLRCTPERPDPEPTP